MGISSLRRTVLLQALRPDLRIEPLRGNLDTRLRKLDEGQYAGIVLAAAGLKRLGLGARIRQVFETSSMLLAVGQGALGIEVRTGSPELPRELRRVFSVVLTFSFTPSRAHDGGWSCRTVR